MKRLKFIKLINIEKIPLFWKNMLMMLCILALCLCALFVTNQTSLDTLSQEHLEKIQLTLDRDCEALDETMYACRYIPDAITDTENYSFLRSEKADELPVHLFPVMRNISHSLIKQMYLQGGSELCILYFPKVNAICTTQRFVPTAEQFFSDYLSYSATDTNIITGYLNDAGGLHFLPMQTISNRDKHESIRCLTLLIHPQESELAVMNLYSEQYILDRLSIPYLPDGTKLRITADNGEVLMQYPLSDSANSHDDYYILEASLDKVDIHAELRIPKAHFNSLLFPVRRTWFISIISVMLVGIGLSILFSRVSVDPIKKLIQRHGDSQPKNSGNEICHLDSLLTGAQKKNDLIHAQLTRQLLARAMSGSVLSEQDENQLIQNIRYLSEDYRIAILYTTEDINEQLGAFLDESIPQCVWSLTSSRETGCILPGKANRLEQLQEMVARLNAKGCHLLCGVSAAATDLSSLHKAVRQARAALPQDPSLRVFPGEQIRAHAISWLQHQRLYQSIFTGSEEESSEILLSISKNTGHDNAMEVFYNIRFVIHSAAEEMEIPFSEKDIPEFTTTMLPRENILALLDMLHNLFHCLREKNLGKIEDERLAILDFMQRNITNYEFCAASVAEEFGILEQTVYRKVRAYTGKSFNEYLTSLRMNRAASLLYCTQIGISQVGQECGYRNQSTFYRLFKERFGMSPGQYRSKGSSGQK